MRSTRGHIPWSNVDRRLKSMADDHVYRVRPRLVSAWSYAVAATRTDWNP